MTSTDIMRQARTLIGRGWCQDVDARDHSGVPIHPWNRDARSWSVLGSLAATESVGRYRIGPLPVPELGEAIVALGEAANTHTLEAWNDDATRTKDEVLKAFDVALAAVLARHPVAAADVAASARD